MESLLEAIKTANNNLIWSGMFKKKAAFSSGVHSLLDIQYGAC